MSVAQDDGSAWRNDMIMGRSDVIAIRDGMLVAHYGMFVGHVCGLWGGVLQMSREMIIFAWF